MPDDVGYAAAMTELDAILAELEREPLDVDVLAERVRRASELIQLCRSRILRAQADVDRIVADLDTLEAAAPDGVANGVDAATPDDIGES